MPFSLAQFTGRRTWGCVVGGTRAGAMGTGGVATGGKLAQVEIF